MIRGHAENLSKKEIEQLIKTHSPLLKKHRDSWGAALNFFTEYSYSEQACLYGDLWRNFLPNLNPGILSGYASFVDETRNLAAGHNVRMAILKEFPQWEGTKFLRVGAAFQKAMDGRVDEAEDFIAGYLDRHEPQDFYDSIYQHTLANIAAHRDDATACEKHFRAAANHMRKFPEDVASLRYLGASAEACAKTLNPYKGNPRKILKKWAKGLGKKKLDMDIPWWAILLIIWIIAQIVSAAGK